MKVDVKIYISNGKNEPFFGRGPADLIGFIKQTKSIKKAAGKMNMSYSKAHKIIKRLENGVGEKVAVRQAGGNGGGATILTEFGEKLLDKYRRFEEDAKNCIQKRFVNFTKQIKK